ncbi:hypothetical protein D0A42_08590 [Xanthomonas campestris pv. campestris]|nr:hypothetical protein D0A42_08590 [Xanthomonas campestris pv. campestris]
MPRKSLQGRTCGVSRDGGRARTPAAKAQIEPLLAVQKRVQGRTCDVSRDGGRASALQQSHRVSQV